MEECRSKACLSRQITKREEMITRDELVSRPWGVRLVNGKLVYEQGKEQLNNNIRPLLRRWDICFNCRGVDISRHGSGTCPYPKAPRPEESVNWPPAKKHKQDPARR